MLYDMKYMLTHNQMHLLYQNHISNFMYQNETICEDNMKVFFEVLKRQDVFVFGTGYSEIICHYFYKKLIVNGIRSYMVNGLEFDTIYNRFHHTIGSVLLISKSGLTPYIVNIAESAKKKDIPVISFTGNMKNSLKELSDIPFVIENGLYHDYDNSEYSPFFGYSIILFENLLISLKDQPENKETV